MKDNSGRSTRMARAYEAMLPKEFGGTGQSCSSIRWPCAAAMSAIGFGVASHAFGLWMGTMAGARRGFATGFRGQARRLNSRWPRRRQRGRRKPRLEAVSSNEGAEQAVAPSRPAAKTKVVARKVAAKPRKRADAAVERCCTKGGRCG